MPALAVQDLFAAGLGYDIAGGYLVVRGLLLDDIELRRVSGTYWGLSHGDLLGRIRDRVDARAGLIGLVGGFAIQIVAYAVVLAGAGDSSTGLARALVAVAAGIGGAGLVLAFSRVARPSAIRRGILEVSRVDPEVRGKREEPLRGLLIPLGEEAGYPRRLAESDDQYALRVFGVAELFAGSDY